MKPIQAIVYRYLTDNDFFTIYKPPGTETGGGGQLYIDFLTSQIPVTQWNGFFNGVTGLARSSVRNGPQWEFPVHSIGLRPPTRPQVLRVYQRRAASICIPNQNINTKSANRVTAWSPSRGFPSPSNPSVRNSVPDGLVVFLVRTSDDEVWAGWLRNAAGRRSVPAILRPMFDARRTQGDVGYVQCSGAILLDEGSTDDPFAAPTEATLEGDDNNRAANGSSAGSDGRSGPRETTPASSGVAGETPGGRRERSEEELIESLFGEDEVEGGEEAPELRQAIITIRRRNHNAVRGLKQLYGYRCQITGERLTFVKRDGFRYVEAHHLVPLGKGGADNPRNIIVVSPLVHRMLHYANVTGVDLSRVVEHSDGSATLAISINDEPFTITWHREHASRVTRGGG